MVHVALVPLVHVPLLPGFPDYNALSLPGEFFLDTSPEKNLFRDFFKFPQFFHLFLALTPTPLSNPRREIVLEATREVKATHAPCNFRLESVPLPRLSLLPLLSKVTATSPACSHEKTPPITHIIRRSETVGKKTQQPSRTAAQSLPRKEVRVAVSIPARFPAGHLSV